MTHPPAFAPAPTPLTQIAAPARDKVVRFNERFKRCRAEIDYLNGYKELHDCLHKLQESEHPLPALDVDAALPWVEKKIGLELAPRQRDAIRDALDDRGHCVRV